jgi:hypothetical protein
LLGGGGNNEGKRILWYTPTIGVGFEIQKNRVGMLGLFLLWVLVGAFALTYQPLNGYKLLSIVSFILLFILLILQIKRK